MKPRVFVSSTYYDLKYIRENVEHFITQYGFDAVLFESGKVTFEYGKSLDLSCYQEVETCHMMILVIGGRYGSIASTEDPIEKMDRYDKEYASITKQEFETAQRNKIPVFVFIDKNVYSEYQTYKSNEAFFSNNKTKKIKDEPSFIFAHVDSINIFRFIDSLTHNAIRTFEKADEITEYLRLQLAGMFFMYLDQIRKSSTNNEILSSVNQLQNTASKIDTIVDAIARQIMNESQFKEIGEKQFKAVCAIFTDGLSRYINFDIAYESGNEPEYSVFSKMTEVFMVELFDKNHKLESNDDYKKFSSDVTAKIIKLISDLEKRVIFQKAHLIGMYRQYKDNVEPFMTNNEKRELFKDDFTKSLYEFYLPF